MNSEASSDSGKAEWLIYDDGGGAAPGEPVVEEIPWRVLIVDDDVDVHVVTRFALRNVTYLGRRLKLFHAYTGAEAYDVLRDTPDIALVLLDVVMETADAGLRLARQIRGELNNQLVRVVLRTGHAGQALEQSVIVDYDINDYRTKTELTTQKLFTTVISSLRTYDSLLATERSQRELNATLAKHKDLQFALDQHAMVSVTDLDGKITHVNESFCRATQYSPDELLGRDHRIINSGSHPKEFFADLWQNISQGRSWHGQIRNRAKDGAIFWSETTIVPCLGEDGKPYQYVAVRNDISERKLVEERLRLAEARMRGMFEVSPMAISILRLKDKKRLFANQIFLQTFKLGWDQAKEIDGAQLCQNPAEYQILLQKAAESESVVNHPMALQAADQQKFNAKVSVFMTEYEGESALLVWFCDCN
ncbi:PAS domain-containing protein [Massilia sp. W12]|uniref:PAS domain-containing protein n=1 Tax=Massilia sp. W12 TaxID=3126507 RepID=UPI0030CAB22B